uniref:NADH dehydrogenase subunit 2 n=1 Tax=Jakoba bahamiensis TaxID=221721 RepID=M4Q9R4_9EUKA|nr:NADH dehydrogenase subunit 2 [Jakoba bahamiensis]AGH24111.1 NADH dehydrogenase subunit 2 [Jakoba bahamiensis]
MDFFLMFQNDFQSMFLESYLCVALMILLVYGVIYSTSSKYSYPVLIKSVAWMCALSMVYGLFILFNTPTESKSILNSLAIHDDIAQFGKGIVLFSSISCLLISMRYFSSDRINFFEYGILILLATVGMLTIISSYDIMTMYLAIEFQSLCLYVLAAFKRNSLLSAEAGLKYFILGAFSSGILLFGMSMIYGFTGHTGFEEIGSVLNSHIENSIVSSGVILGIIFIGAGLLFKVYAVPFHVWVPDVYEGSPTAVTSFFAIVPSISVLILLMRLYHSVFFDYISYWQPIFVACSVLSMLVGSFGALGQQKIKRLIAYSAIGHVGFVLVAFATGTPEGLSSILIYSIIYIIMNLNFFSVLLSLRKQDDGQEVEFLEDLSGLYRKNAGLAASLGVVFFSMAGIPPLAGFFSKLYVFLSAIHVSLYFPVMVGIVASVVSAVYYLRVIRIIYFKQPVSWYSFEVVDKVKAFYISVTMFILMFFFIYSSPILILVHKIGILMSL